MTTMRIATWGTIERLNSSFGKPFPDGGTLDPQQGVIVPNDHAAQQVRDQVAVDQTTRSVPAAMTKVEEMKTTGKIAPHDGLELNFMFEGKNRW